MCGSQFHTYLNIYESVDDSDDDMLTDAQEAGDADLSTPPVNTDGDDLPDELSRCSASVIEPETTAVVSRASPLGAPGISDAVDGPRIAPRLHSIQ